MRSPQLYELPRALAPAARCRHVLRSDRSGGAWGRDTSSLRSPPPAPARQHSELLLTKTCQKSPLVFIPFIFQVREFKRNFTTPKHGGFSCFWRKEQQLW